MTRKRTYKAADAAHPEKEESPRIRPEKKKKSQDAPQACIGVARSAFEQNFNVQMKPLQLELTHYCGKPMGILLDAEGPDDSNYRTWAWCKHCQQLGLIHEGKWQDPRVIADKNFFVGTKTVQ